MASKRAYVGWAFFLWLLLIFGTSCTFIDIHDFIRYMQRASPDPKVQERIANFWWNYGIFVVKGWHATEYAILVTLCTVTIRRWRGWNAAPAIAVSLVIAVLFAASDEWHQTFVDGRDGCVRDVFIDSGGALLAALCMAAGAYRARRRSMPPIEIEVKAAPGS